MYSDTEEQEQLAIENGYKEILKAWKSGKKTKADIALVREAFDLAVKAHSNTRRKSGEPYIFHPIAVAKIAAQELGLGKTSIICALLHDVVEDTEYTLDDIREQFGPTVASIIDGLTKIDDVPMTTNGKMTSPQAETFRKVLLSFSYDIRVILIKLADRLHNMRTLTYMPREKQVKIASETEYIYAPLAHRLGYYNVKNELENLSLKFLEPEIYNMIEDKIRLKKKDYQRFINKFIYPIKSEMAEKGMKFEILARFKSVYSIWKKMSEKKVDFDDIDDLFAIRIIVDSDKESEKFDCWKIYSIVTNYYMPKQDRLRDWISTPKANGYEALHATVMSPTGQWVEVQIRSKRMDDIAENGLAAHWKYKDKVDDADSKLDQWINLMKKMIENLRLNKDDDGNAIGFVDDFKSNLFTDEIFVFTPKGELRTLPKGATVLDFAYAIHTAIGDSCIGAKINNKLASISTVINSGDQVEILTSKSQHPKDSWLGIAQTQRAKSRIRLSLNNIKKEKFEEGKSIMEKWAESLNLKLDDNKIASIMANADKSNLIDLYYSIAMKYIELDDFKFFAEVPSVSKRRFSFFNKSNKTIGKTLPEIIKEQTGKDVKSLLLSDDVTSLTYKLCKRCNPIPGDDVIGFINPGQDISIHRTNCPEAIKLMSHYGNKIVKAKWRKGEEAIVFLAAIEIKGTDRKGLIAEITSMISVTLNINMRNVTFQASEGIFEGSISCYIKNSQELNDLITKLKQIDGIHSVVRVNRS